MKHADMHPTTKARVDAGAALGRRIEEFARARELKERGHASEAYVKVKREEYRQALNVMIAAAQAEGSAQAANALDQIAALDAEGRNPGYAASPDYWNGVGEAADIARAAREFPETTQEEGRSS